MGIWIWGGCALIVGHSALSAVSLRPIVGSYLGVALGNTLGCGFVLPYLWFALELVSAVTLGGGFVLSCRWFALWLVLAVAFGGGCVSSYRWSALGLVLDAMVGGGFALSYRSRLVLVLNVPFDGGIVLSFG